MGVHSWERSCMEYLISVYKIWDAVFGSKLAGPFVPRELCKWARSLSTHLWYLRTRCWAGYNSQGMSFTLPPFSQALSILDHRILARDWRNLQLKSMPNSGKNQGLWFDIVQLSIFSVIPIQSKKVLSEVPTLYWLTWHELLRKHVYLSFCCYWSTCFW